jgi:hypothetical protein
MYKTNRTVPSREHALADYRVEKQAHKWQPTRSSTRAVGVTGAVRGNVDYRGDQRTAVSTTTDGYAIAHIGCKHQAF